MARFTLPRDLYFGKGALENLKGLKGKKAIICVGGGSMKRFGFLDRAQKYLEEAGMEVALFEGIESDPSVETVMKGAQKMLEFEQLAGTDDASLIARADVAFHDAIFESTGNMRLGQMVNNLAEQMYRYRFEYIKDRSGHEKLVSEHRLIYDAIIRADIEEATKQISVHIKNQEDSIINQIRSEKGN